MVENQSLIDLNPERRGHPLEGDVPNHILDHCSHYELPDGYVKTPRAPQKTRRIIETYANVPMAPAMQAIWNYLAQQRADLLNNLHDPRQPDKLTAGGILPDLQRHSDGTPAQETLRPMRNAV